MSADKLTRKEIRSPDAFQRVSTEYWKQLIEHRKAVLGVGGGLVAVVLIAAIISHAGHRRDAAAGAALSQAMEAMRQGVQGSFDPSADQELPKFATAKEKSEEIARRMGEVRSQHAGTAAARTATYYLADAQFQLGQLDDATKSFEEYVAASPKGDALKPFALEGLGYIYESRQQWDKALESFDRMGSESAADALKAQAGFDKARVLEQSGKKQEASAAFQKVKDDFKDAPAAKAAGDRLSLLAAQGTMPAASADAKPAAAK